MREVIECVELCLKSTALVLLVLCLADLIAVLCRGQDQHEEEE